MLSLYFINPKNIRTKKIYKKQTNQQTNNLLITKQDIHTKKMKKRKLKPIPCGKISCLYQSLTCLFLRKNPGSFQLIANNIYRILKELCIITKIR